MLKALDNSTDSLPLWWDELLDEATSKMIQEGYKKEEIVLKKRFIYLRFKGQESTLEIEFNDDSNLKKDFQTAYQNLYGHWLESHQIEIESIRLIAAVKSQLSIEKKGSEHSYQPTTISYQKSFSNGNWKPTPIYIWEELLIGATIRGRAIIVSNNTTMYVDDGWEFVLNDYNDAHIVKFEETDQKDTLNSEEAEIELYKNRFTSIVEDMGALLQRTSFSVNVKERLDFSCTLLDEKATLIANAPHIPVHLGSMGICVRRVLENVNIKEGDVIITNHPAFGGSHLPDITLISGAFYQDELIGYVANRAHHSEVGGETPGSMPATATELEQEGVIISPEYLVKDGIAQWDRIKSLLTNARFPTRSLAENIADLEGALASINIGVINLKKLCDLYGSGKTKRYMTRLTEYVSDKLEERTINYSGKSFEAEEQLDDGSLLKTNIKFERDEIIFDFTGSSFIHSGNLNANEAIVQSVVLYVLRLLVNLDLPLNEGLMKNVKIINPKGLLNPDFSGENLPAVVGGNTEVSQRLTDTLLKALNLAACSQGTMNNLLFGNHEFGYYETICGGTGAGKGFNGHDAIHQHMTNTRITDPEILELRYPVRLNRFNIREESGGSGEFKGGNGVEREFLFLENLKVTLLTQHRIITPYGLKGGGNGEVGKQTLIKKNQLETSLASITSIEVNEGDRIVISTPGGGGYGKIKK
ncbi:MAG: hydantoinase B/oxoprolinase family protein [Bacteroidota bacterium]